MSAPQPEFVRAVPATATAAATRALPAAAPQPLPEPIASAQVLPAPGPTLMAQAAAATPAAAPKSASRIVVDDDDDRGRDGYALVRRNDEGFSMSGDSDDIVWEHLHSQGLARDIAGSELVRIKGIGHKPDYLATDVAIAALEKIAGMPRDLQATARIAEQRLSAGTAIAA